MSKSQRSNLPSTVSNWKEAVAKTPVTRGTLDDARMEKIFPSGSGFEFQHALYLRVLYKQENRGNISKNIEKEHSKTSKYSRLLKSIKGGVASRKFEDFQNVGTFGPFLELLAIIMAPVDEDFDGNDEDREKIVFSPKRLRPRSAARDDINLTPSKSVEIFETPRPNTPDPKLHDLGCSSISVSSSEVSPDDKSPLGTVDRLQQNDVKVRDEQTVNMCLINLLQPISWNLNLSKVIDPTRQKFHFDVSKEWEFSACVDGLVRNGREIRGLLEVKRADREWKTRYQEVAEIVAFIFQEEAQIISSQSREFSPFIISQCAHQLWISRATLGRSYCSFLKDFQNQLNSMQNLNSEGFLTIKEYGPFSLDKENDLAVVLPILEMLLCT